MELMGAKTDILPHPVMQVPTPAQAAAMGQTAFLKALRERERMMQREKRDPLRYGWEPPIWRVCYALLGAPWVDEDWARAMRECLGFEEKVTVLFILGGNRGGKSEFAAKSSQRTLNMFPGCRVWGFHSTHPMAVEYQHPLLWKYMPPEYQRDVKGQVEYIAYKQKTGFSDDKFVLRNAAQWTSKNYAQEMDDAIEGGNIKMFWADELVPPDWVETLELRIAEQDGWGVVTFTPVQGYTPTVRLAQDGAKVVRECPCYLVPRDGGAADVPRALGFESEGEMARAHRFGRWSVPERCDEWLEGKRGHPAPPAGRVFDKAPRVLKCTNENYAMVFFHSSDNPYGNPMGVWKKIRTRSDDHKKERFYGVAHKTVSAKFPKFSVDVHVVPADAIPKEGTNYMFMDPAGSRNFFMKWYRVTQEGAYLYREWPGNYEIPGEGVPGPWALPSGKRLDGKAGPAQRSFGWGLLRYKQEIARLEGWRALAPEMLTPGNKRKALTEWTDEGAEERIFMRFIDSRAATPPKMEKDRPSTLLTDFEEINLFFELTPGDDIEEGIQDINDALDYDDEREIDYFNKPRFYVSDACVNSIFALQTWTGRKTQDSETMDLKGACKDPIDLDRYFFREKCQYVSDEEWAAKGGTYY